MQTRVACVLGKFAAVGTILVALASAPGATAQEADVPGDVALSAPGAPDLPIILENVAEDDGKGCASLCMQILVKTAHPVIIDGVSYRRLEGAACTVPERAESVRQ